jgi:hypothetical protein
MGLSSAPWTAAHGSVDDDDHDEDARELEATAVTRDWRSIPTRQI